MCSGKTERIPKGQPFVILVWWVFHNEDGISPGRKQFHPSLGSDLLALKTKNGATDYCTAEEMYYVDLWQHSLLAVGFIPLTKPREMYKSRDPGFAVERKLGLLKSPFPLNLDPKALRALQSTAVARACIKFLLPVFEPGSSGLRASALPLSYDRWF